MISSKVNSLFEASLTYLSIMSFEASSGNLLTRVKPISSLRLVEIGKHNIVRNPNISSLRLATSL